MMGRVDAFLSRKAQVVWPTALVKCFEDTPAEGEQRWQIDFGTSPDGFTQEKIGLGSSFKEAQEALKVTLLAEIARRGQ